MSKPFPLRTLICAKCFPKCLSRETDSSGKTERFSKLILQRRQMEIEKNDMKEFLAAEEQALSECSDLVQRQDLKLELAIEEAKLRTRSLGIKFIAELYNFQFL